MVLKNQQIKSGEDCTRVAEAVKEVDVNNDELMEVANHHLEKPIRKVKLEIELTELQ